MRWLLGSFMHRTLRCTHPFWIVFGSGTTCTRRSKSVLDFSKSDSFIWGKRPKTHGGRKLSSQGNPSSSMALAWHWLSSVCKWLNNIMPRYLHWWWDIMRCASFCRRLSIARISARLALAFLSSAWSSFLRVHNLRACIRISQESLASSDLWEGEPAAWSTLYKHRFRFEIRLHRLPLNAPLLFVWLYLSFRKILAAKRTVAEGKGSRCKSIWWKRDIASKYGPGHSDLPYNSGHKLSLQHQTLDLILEVSDVGWSMPDSFK